MKRPCEARKLDLLLFGPEEINGKAVEKCDDMAEKFFFDFALCQGCIDGLDGFVYLAKNMRGEPQ